MKKIPYRKAAVLIAVLLGICAGILSYTEVFSETDRRVTDWVYDHAKQQEADSRITILALDEKSEEVYGEPDSLSRSIYANAIEKLTQEQAAVIGLDLDLTESGDEAGDKALEEACSKAGNVVAAASAVFEDGRQNKKPEPDTEEPKETENPKDTEELKGTENPKDAEELKGTENPKDTEEPKGTENPKDAGAEPESRADAGQKPSVRQTEDDRDGQNPAPADASIRWGDQKVTSVRLPYDALCAQAGIGIVNASQQSPDGNVRSASLSVSCDGTEYDSFSYAVYKKYQSANGKTDEVLPQMQNGQLFGFQMMGDGRTCATVSMADFLDGNYDSAMIRDKIVLIGTCTEENTGGLNDFLSPKQSKNDVVLQTSVLQTLLNKKAILTVNRLLQALIYSVLIAAFYLIATGRRPVIIVGSVAGLSFVIVAAGYLANQKGRRFELLIPLVFLAVILILSLIQRLVGTAFEKKKMERTFKMYVDSSVVDEVAEKSPEELAAVGQRRNIAVLFVDIRGFTTISESLEPEQVVEILNQYLSRVADAVKKYGGTLDKFIGDAAMAIFNAPGDLEDYCFCAVCAAQEILKHSGEIRGEFREKFGVEVTVGIGINCGEAIVGNIGCESRMDYTAIGDTVNTAARLEANAKPGQILISQSVYEAVAGRISAKDVGALSLKGKLREVQTYQIS